MDTYRPTQPTRRWIRCQPEREQTDRETYGSISSTNTVSESGESFMKREVNTHDANGSNIKEAFEGISRPITYESAKYVTHLVTKPVSATNSVSLERCTLGETDQPPR